MKISQIICWIAQLTAAIIMLQTLSYKFTAHPESVYIFSKLGLEPYGRVGIGIAELITSILILIPRTSWLGAILTIGLMGGAIFSHLTQLGINVQNDGGNLFILALITLLAGALVLFFKRKDIPLIGKSL